MWMPTDEQVAYYKLISQNPNLSDDYVRSTLPLLLKFAEGKTGKAFDSGNLPGGVELFLAHSLSFFGTAQVGVKGKRMGTVSYTTDYSKLPDFILDFLGEFMDTAADGKKPGTFRYFSV